ncbi:MAG TPA: anaerobic sulfatase maturase [Clostridia bacterium]|nr:anaerobic sulfatase maturase [Clostridia bacterium]
MKNTSVLIKPASGRCNMKCTYCFYCDEITKRKVKDRGLMTKKTAEQIIKKTLDFSQGGLITYAFQGGEPTLRGLDFYKYFTKKVKELNHKRSKINYAIQTNGILIDEKWAKFFYNEKFLIGLSLDGTKNLNNINRIDLNDKGTFKRIIKASEVLKEYNVSFNVVTVVNSINVRKIIKIYNFYKKKGFNYMQFIPCLEPLGEKFGDSKYALSSKEYGKFLIKLFNVWYRDVKDGNYVSIRYFDNLLSMYLGKEPESCDMRGVCSIQNVIEADGSVYPCDFYVIDEFYMGNINEKSINEIIKSSNADKFIKKSLELTEDCKKCPWIRICRGGCRRHKTEEGSDGLMKNYFCESFKEFHEYSNDKFKELAFILSRRR